MGTFRLAAAACGLMFALGSFGAATAAGPSPAEPRPSPLKRHRVTSADGEASLTVEAAAPPTLTPADRNYSLEIPIGTRMSIGCIVGQDIDAAASLERRMRRLLGTASKREITTFEAGVENGIPFIAVEARFTDREGEGFWRVIAGGLPDRGFLCVHDDPGARAIFRRIVGQVGETLAIKRPSLFGPAICRQVSVMTVDGRRVGYEAAAFFRDPSNELQRFVRTTYVTITPTDLSGFDITELVLGHDGIVEKGLFGSTNGRGEADWMLALERQRGSTYSVEGRHKGQPISTTFEARLETVDRTLQRVRSTILGKRNAELRAQIYTPTNPLGATETILRAAADGSYESVTGPVKTKVELDERGQVTRNAGGGGGHTVEMVRLFATGSCP